MALLLTAACARLLRPRKQASYKITVDAAYASVCETAQSAQPGETVLVRLPAVTEQYYLLFVNGAAQEMDRERSDREYTCFTFTMPDRDVYIGIQTVPADIP